MDDLDTMVVSVRADTQGFARDVAEMRGALDGPLVAGADRAGRAIETTLLRAVRTGKLGFEDLRRVAIGVMSEIAQAAIGGGVASLLGGARTSRGSAGGLLSGLLAAVVGAPGRATGGPVSPGRAYRVGENGPEYFVPTAAGRVETGVPSSGAREVRVAITVKCAGRGTSGGAAAVEPAGGTGGQGGVGRAGVRGIGGRLGRSPSTVLRTVPLPVPGRILWGIGSRASGPGSGGV